MWQIYAYTAFELVRERQREAEAARRQTRDVTLDVPVIRRALAWIVAAIGSGAAAVASRAMAVATASARLAARLEQRPIES